VPREPPSIEQVLKVPADQHEYRCTGHYAASDHQQGRARDRIVNERKREWQARDNNNCQHEYQAGLHVPMIG
jgi:hypothetical protein